MISSCWSSNLSIWGIILHCIPTDRWAYTHVSTLTRGVEGFTQLRKSSLFGHYSIIETRKRSVDGPCRCTQVAAPCTDSIDRINLYRLLVTISNITSITSSALLSFQYNFLNQKSPRSLTLREPNTRRMSVSAV